MMSSSQRYHRRSIRLQGYDYAQAGAYFFTVCVHDRQCLFGQVMDGKMTLTPAGCMVQTVWDQIPSHYPGVQTDAFSVMPNHVHGIVILVGAGPRACPDPLLAQPGDGQPGDGQPTMSLADVVHRFKTLTTKRYVDGVRQQGWPPFAGKLWQRNYYEHIIRDHVSLNRTRQYIVENPARWHEDRRYIPRVLIE